MDMFLSTQTVLYTGALFCFLVIFYRVLVVPVFCFLFFGIGLLVLTINAASLDLQFFTWVKTYTLVISLFIIILMREASERSKKRFKLIIYFIFILNIAEPVLFDVTSRLWANALVGLSLIATLSKASSINVEEYKGRRHVSYDLPWCWIIAYSLWNITFIYGHYSLHYFDHLAVLLAPILIAQNKGVKQLWFETRAITLTLHVITIIFTIDFFKLPWIPPAPTQPLVYDVMLALSIFSGAVNFISWTTALKKPAFK